MPRRDRAWCGSRLRLGRFWTDFPDTHPDCSHQLLPTLISAGVQSTSSDFASVPRQAYRICVFTIFGTHTPAMSSCGVNPFPSSQGFSVIRGRPWMLRYAHAGDRETAGAVERVGGLISGLLGTSPAARRNRVASRDANLLPATITPWSTSRAATASMERQHIRT